MFSKRHNAVLNYHSCKEPRMPKSHSTSSTRLWLMPTLVTLVIAAALVGAFFWGRSTAPPQADSGGGDTAQQGTEQNKKVPQEVAVTVLRREQNVLPAI